VSRKLHIGGKYKVDGWEILDALAASHVDHVCNANDLTRFADHTFSEIYASHVVEHFDFKEELVRTLMEWLRVMKPGGQLLVSVPDLEILARFIVEKDKLTIRERFSVMTMIFGSHDDEYDYHMVGLEEGLLTTYLRNAGFVNVRRVPEFGLFRDFSIARFKGVPISLNMIAEKPRQA
jgi:predicted SAM-dependent methyltransferase